MMLEILHKTIVTFLVIYAVSDILVRIYGFFASDIFAKDKYIAVIRVKNCEDELENAVRSVIMRTLSRRGGGELPYLLIVDLGSDDGTAEIAKRLCLDYDFVYYMTDDEYNDFRRDK